MDSSVSPKEEIWFLRVCHHISTGLYHRIIAINSMNRLVIVMKTHCLSYEEGKQLLIACYLK